MEAVDLLLLLGEGLDHPHARQDVGEQGVHASRAGVVAGVVLGAGAVEFPKHQEEDGDGDEGQGRQQRVHGEQDDAEHGHLDDVDEEVGDAVAEEAVDGVGVVVDLGHEPARLSAVEEAQGQPLDGPEDGHFQIEDHAGRDLGGDVAVDDVGQLGQKLGAHHDGDDQQDLAVELALDVQHLVVEEAAGEVGGQDARGGQQHQGGDHDEEVGLILEQENREAVEELALLHAAGADPTVSVRVPHPALGTAQAGGIVVGIHGEALLGDLSSLELVQVLDEQEDGILAEVGHGGKEYVLPVPGLGRKASARQKLLQAEVLQLGEGVFPPVGLVPHPVQPALGAVLAGDQPYCPRQDIQGVGGSDQGGVAVGMPAVHIAVGGQVHGVPRHPLVRQGFAYMYGNLIDFKHRRDSSFFD